MASKNAQQKLISRSLLPSIPNGIKQTVRREFLAAFVFDGTGPADEALLTDAEIFARRILITRPSDLGPYTGEATFAVAEII